MPTRLPGAPASAGLLFPRESFFGPYLGTYLPGGTFFETYFETYLPGGTFFETYFETYFGAAGQKPTYFHPYFFGFFFFDICAPPNKLFTEVRRMSLLRDRCPERRQKPTQWHVAFRIAVAGAGACVVADAPYR
jgi:hypothetical protein